jgi:hypothetical protein
LVISPDTARYLLVDAFLNGFGLLAAQVAALVLEQAAGVGLEGTDGVHDLHEDGLDLRAVARDGHRGRGKADRFNVVDVALR